MIPLKIFNWSEIELYLKAFSNFVYYESYDLETIFFYIWLKHLKTRLT